MILSKDIGDFFSGMFSLLLFRIFGNLTNIYIYIFHF